jgi:hypothetical protein
MCSDYKFLLLVFGLAGAVSNHPCLWCNQHKDEFHKCDLTDATMRTMEDLLAGGGEAQKSSPLLNLRLDRVFLGMAHGRRHRRMWDSDF